MKKKSLFVFVLFTLVGGCTWSHLVQQKSSVAQDSKRLPATAENIPRLAVGSCNKENLDQSYWDVILRQDPDKWIWLGDNIYGDSSDPAVLKSKWDSLFENPFYKNFRSQVPVTGTWDDHDYGENDGGKDFAIKAESQQLFQDFMGIPVDSPLRKRQGVYRSEEMVFEKNRIKIIMLDSRYHRTKLKRNLVGAYVPSEGDFLGAEQWAWLEKEIKESATAQALIVANGIGVINDKHPYEKWGNFPKQRERLLTLVQASPAPIKVLLSGDRHFGEISKILTPKGQFIYELQSSGLTHSFEKADEANEFRIGSLVATKHFALIDFYNESGALGAKLQLINLPAGQLVHQVIWGE